MEKAIVTFYTVTAMHAGSGSTIGAIDLPIQREVHTNFPVIPGSSLKGALRQTATDKWGKNGKLTTVFGPETSEGDKHGGSVLVGEAKLLALPVRSIQSVFFWVTCPMILQRLVRDLKQLGIKDLHVPTVTDDNTALIPEDLDELRNSGGRLVLEDLDFATEKCDDLKALITLVAKNLVPENIGQHFMDKLQKHLVVVSDENMAYLSVNGTQVASRIVLDDATKTSKNLWQEETLPSETILWSFVIAREPRANGLDSAKEVMDAMREILGNDEPVQIGGNETVGNGWCFTKLYTGGNAQ
ncbi:CRISPR-associated RAMP protein, Cmr4 family [Thermobaculum terrenum ATCC BAA-798]|uniref:CRISPR-associated RAMP protein, Cmr4 family n=1 Tax=Thermobaculum terrenum (strain ATCC BAA-798 / CCMEE 7001 / YNP1) TaxID=525904 RepID=D1CGI4_THET1|nr:type III-B CRISPR module RAMP protein Cmr4 [Thermobaculum terrenum]ACZ42855.1 CRISPR-associated RAMP protein, Cmr4 family [Thermobaculum terrenum ATCC BAA-798]